MARPWPSPRAASGADVDVTDVVRALRRWGPQSLPELAGDPEFMGWARHRVEQAVVAAWSRNLIFIDARSLLVAL